MAERTAALAAALLVVVLTGCSSGRSCDELGALVEQRDAARDEFSALVADRSTGRAVTEAEVEALHDRLHDLEQRAYDLEQQCEDR